jgi:ADP-ribose pyrophosphatase
LPELLEQVKRGEITDVKTIIGTFWLEKIIGGSWKPA